MELKHATGRAPPDHEGMVTFGDTLGFFVMRSPSGISSFMMATIMLFATMAHAAPLLQQAQASQPEQATGPGRLCAMWRGMGANKDMP